MSSCPPSDLLDSFDPALHLHSEGLKSEQYRGIDASHSDDIEILNNHNHETIATKTAARIVIQHRSWKLSEAFRSEDEPINRVSSPLAITNITSSHARQCSPIPSSPPSYNMPYLSSSPVGYPASSSPTKEPRHKRKRSDQPRSPLAHADGNVIRSNIGGFVDDDSEEDVEFGSMPKRRAFLKPPHLDTQQETEFRTVEDILAEQQTQGRDGVPEKLGETNTCASEQNNTTENSALSSRTLLAIRSSTGRVMYTASRRQASRVSYEQLISSRSKHVEGRAEKSFYGVDIHGLMDEAAAEAAQHNARAQLEKTAIIARSVEASPSHGSSNKVLLWTEKYRARKFTDLVGDERTHRSVLRWLKAWDELVFPGAARTKPRKSQSFDQDQTERTHRKILMLTGPPGLGKTTLAHVCARQAGYEVQEINASDERSSTVVKGRIRDMVGTENVRGGKASKPVCVVVDEVDGVVGGNSSAGGEGGFVKALIDLVLLDQRNSKTIGSLAHPSSNKRRQGDKFRLMRPLILICNDVYHPSLRPLRQSSLAEVVHMRKPALNVVASRMQNIFERERVPCDGDGVRRLCEATWGVSNHKEGQGGSGSVEGDIRSILVVAEWIAGKLRSCNDASLRLTRRWLEEHVLSDLAHGGGAARSLGRGGAKDVAERVFLEGAGFPKSSVPAAKSEGERGEKPVGVAEAHKRRALDRLREMVDMSGDIERIMTDLFTSYPTHPYQDDTFLSKPNTCYDWLHFHDSLSSQVFSSQEWELAPYLSSAPLAFHHLFASSETKHNLYAAESSARNGYRNHRNNGDTETGNGEETKQALFSGASAPFQAIEALKQHTATLSSFQSSLSLRLARIYRSTEVVATELLPYALRILSPEVKPVIVNTGSKATTGPTSTASVRKASERAIVDHSVQAMVATGVRFERAKLEDERNSRPGSGGWVLRMEPAIDEAGCFGTMDTAGRGAETTRYAVRQVLDGEWRKEVRRLEGEARGRRGGYSVAGAGEATPEEPEEIAVTEAQAKVKRDFFGRVLEETSSTDDAVETNSKSRERRKPDSGIVFCTFHEGYSNAVRKPITLAELIAGL